MDCWQKILKDEGPRAFFKVHYLLTGLFYSLFLCRATLQTCSGQLDARSCWSGTTSASLCWRPTSNRQECHTPPITSDLKTIIDHVISRSCGVRIEWYHIKIMSSLHHATHLKTSDFSLSFWSERIYISSGRTEQYWQTQAYFLALVEKYCFTQGPVFTPNCEISIQWNKLWNFEGTNFVLYEGRTRHRKGGFQKLLSGFFPWRS